jgi:hypothetical protein
MAREWIGEKGKKLHESSNRPIQDSSAKFTGSMSTTAVEWNPNEKSEVTSMHLTVKSSLNGGIPYEH